MLGVGSGEGWVLIYVTANVSFIRFQCTPKMRAKVRGTSTRKDKLERTRSNVPREAAKMYVTVLVKTVVGNFRTRNYFFLT